MGKRTLTVAIICGLALCVCTSCGLAYFAGAAAAISGGKDKKEDGLKITSESPLPQGKMGQAYPAFTFQAAGGTPPYSWSIAYGNVLPPGLNIDPNGDFRGIPSQEGMYNFTVDVSDDRGKHASRPFVCEITTGVVIVTDILPQGSPGNHYSFQLSAANGTPPYTWSRVSGVLPAGVDLFDNGLIMGTPSNTGSFHFTVTVTDTVQDTDQKTLELIIQDFIVAIDSLVLEGTVKDNFAPSPAVMIDNESITLMGDAFTREVDTTKTTDIEIEASDDVPNRSAKFIELR